MIQGQVFIATSLDGFIARKDGDIEWLISLPGDAGNYGYDTFIETVDGLVMGRGSFEKVLTIQRMAVQQAGGGDEPLLASGRCSVRSQGPGDDFNK